MPTSAPPAVHTISLLVRNKPGVLVRVSLVFSRRGYNIESLVVSPASVGRNEATGEFSRMTITCSGDPWNRSSSSSKSSSMSSTPSTTPGRR